MSYGLNPAAPRRPMTLLALLFAIVVGLTRSRSAKR